jgi:hypothetical protein
MLAKAAAAPAPAPAGEVVKTPLLKSTTLRKTPVQAEPAVVAVDGPPRAVTLRTSGLSKTAARLSTPPPAPGVATELKKNASSPSLGRPNKPLPSVTPSPPPPAEEPSPPTPPPVPEAVEDEDGPPPEVPAFEEPPPVPVFDTEPHPEELEEDGGMLDAMLQEIGDTRPSHRAPQKVAASDGLSDSFLDSVFDAIKPSPVAGPAAGSASARSSKPGDVTDSFLDSVFNMTAASPAPSVRMVPQQQQPDDEEVDDDGDLLGAVIGEIEGAGKAPVKSSLALLEEEERPRHDPSHRASILAAAGPLSRSGLVGSPLLSRPRVKSFAPSTVSPITVGAGDSMTIRPPRSSRARAGSKDMGKKMSDAKVRSVMAELKRSGSGMDLVGRVVYDVGRTNPPSALRLWGSKALLVVAGDKIYMRTLGGEENMGNIAEAGSKVVFQEPGSDRLWVAGRDPAIKVYELTKPSQPAHLLTSHSEWVATVEMYAPGVIATASADKTIRVWKLPSLKSLVCKGHLDYVTCLTTVPDPVDDAAPPLLVSASCDKTIRLWNIHVPTRKVTMGEEVRTLFGHTGWVWSVCGDGKGSLWSSARDCSLRNWNVRTGECVKVGSFLVLSFFL